MTTEPVVGKFYLVECIQLVSGRFVPVIGKWHSDADLGVSYEHLHLDVRFFAENELLRGPGKFSRDLPKAQATLGAIITKYEKYVYATLPTVSPEPVLKRLQCRRRMPDMPQITRFKNIEKSFVGRKILCGKCPHKGMPVDSLPKDESGRVICNGHGLAIRDGVVVKR